MKRLKFVFLMAEDSCQRAKDLARDIGLNLEVTCVSELQKLEFAFLDDKDLLLSFGTSVLVPDWILKKPNLIALNIHAASPDYPGRDPHHFAVYDGVKIYGATLHLMTKKIDDGQILDVEWFDVPEKIAPINLLKRANEAGWEIVKRLFVNLYNKNPLQQTTDLEWGKRKTTRKMFIELCKLDPTISEKEFKRRLFSTTVPGYKNLYIDLHGHRFRIEN
jgi:methionyl-tRNA formyltransferase